MAMDAKIMQRATDFYHQVPNAIFPQPKCAFHEPTAFDGADHRFDCDTSPYIGFWLDQAKRGRIDSLKRRPFEIHQETRGALPVLATDRSKTGCTGVQCIDVST